MPGKKPSNNNDSETAINGLSLFLEHNGEC